jgi:hypothetical protein
MKRFLLLFPAVLLLAAAPSASARVIELGAGASAATPSCPGSTSDPCAAVVRMTGLQGRTAGGAKNPYYIRRDGYIVAFTVTLSKPTQDQIDFFNTNFGSPAEVRLSVLRKGSTRKTRLNYRLVGQTDNFRVDKFLGSTPTFVLPKPLRVKKTNWIGITVPTWAPMFAHNLTGSDWWRASRPKDSCEPPKSYNQAAMSVIHDINVFGCTYHRERLLFTATYVPDPRETVKEPK